MSPTQPHVAMAARSALFAILLLAASRCPAQTLEGAGAQAPSAAPAGTVVQRRLFVPYPGYLYPGYHGFCFPYGACGSLLWEIRPPRRPAPPPEPARPAEPDIWATSGSPWGYLRRLPPPTPENQIQPGYREASTLRPEFGEAGGAAPR
jgi:hypothetical protein